MGSVHSQDYFKKNFTKCHDYVILLYEKIMMTLLVYHIKISRSLKPEPALGDGKKGQLPKAPCLMGDLR